MSIAEDIEARLQAKLGLNENGDSGETDSLDLESLAEFVFANPEVYEQRVRTRRDGGEDLTVYLRTELEPQQQRVVLHIPIEPPLGQVPSVESNILSEHEGRIRVTDQQVYGIRLEVILSKASDVKQTVLTETVISAGGDGAGPDCG